MNRRTMSELVASVCCHEVDHRVPEILCRFEETEASDLEEDEKEMLDLLR